MAALRALSILEALAAQDFSPETSEQLVDALLPLLTQKSGRQALSLLPACTFPVS